jgi:PPOX class probable F420-dependent enzyme
MRFVMTAERMRELVAEARVARLATLTPDGRLHLVPISFVLEGNTLYSAVDDKPKRSRRLQRLANVQANPDVAVLVDHYDEDWSRLWWVRLRGRGRVVEDGPEFEAALKLLVDKYEQYGRQPPGGPAIAIEVREWRGWEAG